MASNVNLIDPNEININITKDTNGVPFVNGIPQYQDMYIFAELTAKSKARTVIVTTNDGNVSQGIVKTGFEKPKKVNLLGVNQIDLGEDEKGVNKNPNYLNFTTNYYDGSTGNYTQYESFGINSIKVVINSSYVPQVNIQFIDIRGLSFFNQENSPYRILFDFPPPIFDLAIKGYYGKILTYQLHLVKYTTEFQSDSGNFVIDAQFVAVTFAPLSDILLRYVINSPLMIQPLESTPSTSTPPKNTNELILKLKNLYTAVTDKVKTDTDSKALDRTTKRMEDIRNATSMLANHKVDPILEPLGLSYLIIKKSKDQIYNVGGLSPTTSLDEIITPLNILSEYDAKIKELGIANIPTKMVDRLFLVFPVQYVKLTGDSVTNEAKLTKATNVAEEYRQKIINRTGEILGITKAELETTISKAEFDNYYNVTNKQTSTTGTIKYVGLDFTDYYIKLYKENLGLVDEKINISESLTMKINNMIFERLGMMPTIYNIFKIILDDVDVFFEQLRKVSYDAEKNHHANDTNKNIILGDNYADFKGDDGKIYAFPLIVDREKVVCGGNKEERIAPIQLSKKTLTPFPEMVFVDSFIDTFFTQRKLQELSNMRGEEDAEGVKEWLPISPQDSILGTDDMKSPYYGIDTTTGAVNLSQDNRINQILKIVLDRFYILSQNTVPNSFYKTTGGKRDNSDKAYVEFFATSEAVNLASSASNSNYGNNLKTFADTYKNNVTGFYDYIKTNIPDYYNFTQSNKTGIKISDSSYAYVNKNNSEYIGVKIYEGGIQKQEIQKGSANPVQKFKEDVKQKGFLKKIFARTEKEVFYDFTKENVHYIIDKKIKKDGTDDKDNVGDNDGNNLITRFLSDVNLFAEQQSSTSYGAYGGMSVSQTYPSIGDLLNYGNSALGDSYSNAKRNLKKFENIVDNWVTQLSRKYSGQDFDDLIYNEIIKTPSKLSALFLLSNFGSALGPFNKYPSDLNNLIFTTPAAIEVPKYLPLYIGALIDAFETPWYADIVSFFSGGTGSKFYDRSLFIFADYSDINKYLSAQDKETFREEFLNYYAGGGSSGDYYNYLTRVQRLYEEVTGTTATTKTKAYRNLLDPQKSGAHYVTVLKPLIQRTNMIVFNQNTFKMSNTYNTGYISLSSLTGSTAATVNDNYFKTFLAKLSSEIVEKEQEVKKQEEEDAKKKSDEDIVTQTYYSFKNINDKWLSNPTKENVYGYPHNEPGKRLIDSFVFVDRAMNPVGDNILNAEILIQLFDDPNVTVFTALSQLLSLNNFEFFPLQNFMKAEGAWEDCFRIDTTGEIEKRPAFVCMYIGGTSSYPTNVGNGFADDGIIDLGNTDATDFSTQECPPNPEVDNQLATNEKEFPYRTVRAFRVRFGEQNQSMFTNIKIDSKEYPETNESIQILSRLAGDNKEHAIPKGQNLFNLYENRSYKATVTGLGNAMIQPTQYFQLENVPLFNGAYIILTVEHDITANKMTTSFSGTKIMRYPVPRVTSPLAFMSFDGGESVATNIASLSAGQIVQATQAVTMSPARLAQLNSVFGIDISHHQGNFDFGKAVTANNPDFPNPTFVILKASQGVSFVDKKVATHAASAKAAGLKISYYHYAEQYTGSESSGIIANAKAQAQHFISVVNGLGSSVKPDLPLVLDMEDYVEGNKYWTKIKANNDLWINTFIAELKTAGYNTILYGGKYWFDDKTSGNFGTTPLWLAQYLKEPELNNPKLAKGWNDWTIWQFSSQGKVTGYNGNVDINAMRKSYFNKFV